MVESLFALGRWAALPEEYQGGMRGESGMHDVFSEDEW
jgi:hypothetical protein